MFERMSNGWELAKSSWSVLKLDKEMLIFPLLSGVACLLVFASFALPLMDSSYVQTVTEENAAPEDPLAYILLFAFYFCNYFVIVFFNCALVACAIIRFRGGDPTVADGFRAAMSRLPQILAWAAVSATVGVILRLIESRSEKAGQFAAGLLGMAWSAATYFVVPILVVEQVGPIEAFKRSLSVLRKSWGEALVANFGIGFMVFLGAIVCMLPALLGLVSGNSTFVSAGIVVTVLMFIVLSLISSALNMIVIGALYEFAADDRTPEQFDRDALSHAFVAR